MNKRKLIFLFLFLLVLPFAFSQPPVNYIFISDAPDGLDITSPLFNHHKQTDDFRLNFHTINKSNGVTISPPDVSCEFFLMNSSGEHVYEDNNVANHTDHFDITVNQNNFSELGMYGYTIHCNTSDNGGFISVIFEVTETGEAIQNNIYPVIIGIIAIIIFFSALGYFQRKNLGLLITCLAIALIEIVNLSFMLYLHESAKSMISMLRINFWITFLIVIGIGFIALIFIFLRALNLDDSMDNEDKKWQGNK